MKNLKPILITAGIAIVAVAFIYPFIRPLFQKIPVIGAKAL